MSFFSFLTIFQTGLDSDNGRLSLRHQAVREHHPQQGQGLQWLTQAHPEKVGFNRPSKLLDGANSWANHGQSQGSQHPTLRKSRIIPLRSLIDHWMELICTPSEDLKVSVAYRWVRQSQVNHWVFSCFLAFFQGSYLPECTTILGNRVKPGNRNWWNCGLQEKFACSFLVRFEGFWKEQVETMGSMN